MDLVVGAAIGYTDHDTEPWLVSLRRTGCTAVKDLITGQGNLTGHPIVERFNVIGVSTPPDLRFVVATDVKDLVFQSNPITWLEQNLGDYDIVVQSEGNLYWQCDGNRKNLIEAFGKEAFDSIANEPVMNAGVIAGRASAVAELCREIYALCLQDKRSNVRGITWDDMLPDQAALNLILRKPEWRYRTLFSPPESGFVSEYQHKVARELRDGVLYPAGSSVPYVMFHQYWWADGVADRYRAKRVDI